MKMLRVAIVDNNPASTQQETCTVSINIKQFQFSHNRSGHHRYIINRSFLLPLTKRVVFPDNLSIWKMLTAEKSSFYCSFLDTTSISK